MDALAFFLAFFFATFGAVTRLGMSTAAASSSFTSFLTGSVASRLRLPGMVLGWVTALLRCG